MTSIGTDLRRVVRGRVLAPGDDAFETARLPWNRAIDQQVRAVVEIEDAADAAAVIRYAKLHGVGVTAQAGGHGASSHLDGTILVRTGRLRGIDVRPEQRIAQVEAGVQWGDLLLATGKHGLTGLPGSSPVVSVTGYTLGGGMSWFGRRYGLAANAVRAFDVVDADGARAHVTAESDPDLFWALRGGGGDFALVTSMEVDLHPAPLLYGGRLLWPADRAPQVLDAFREVTATAPDELTVWFTMLRFPPLPHVPEPLRGLAAVAIDTTYLGADDEARALLQRFETIPGTILDTRAPMALDALGGICAEPTQPVPGMQRGDLLVGLDDDVAADLLAAAGGIAPLAAVQVRHLGGALSRPTPGSGACGHLAEPYLLGLLGPVPTPEAAQAVRERQAEISRAMMAHTTGRKPYTYLGGGEKTAAAFPRDVMSRLRDIKRRRDPAGVIRSNHPVLIS
ncbi:FAD-binding oxidoreductase [Nonomuraea sp. NPDC004354]